MSITLNLKPEVAAGLLAHAEAKGMALDEYLESIAERDALQPMQETVLSEPARRREAVRRMFDFGENHHLSLGEPVTRALLHEGHRY
jgi:hypothetical protein